MKTSKIISILVLVTFFTFSCKNEATKEPTVSEESITENSIENASMAKAEFTIEGMTCAMGCAKRIETKLAEMEGVETAKVDFEKKLAMVTYKEGIVTPTSLEETVTKAGADYSVSEMKTVKSFSANQAKHSCSDDCKKEGCTAEKKKACGDDCKKACCVKKA